MLLGIRLFGYHRYAWCLKDFVYLLKVMTLSTPALVYVIKNDTFFEKSLVNLTGFVLFLVDCATDQC